MFLRYRFEQRTGGVWSRERLDAFLANPDAFVPGTTMSFAGISEPAARSKLIDFLQSADRELDVFNNDYE